MRGKQLVLAGHDGFMLGDAVAFREAENFCRIVGALQSDAIMRNGERVGMSRWLAFCANADHLLSISLVNVEDAEPGTEVTLLWGEPNSPRASVEKHEVHEIRATVQPAPYFEKAIKTGKQ
ncbi:hypothetical protein D6851_07070 [Altericroceibacterium spongiae]|uniref:Glycine cleavage T-protein C-terminal barrel domain-containing protein n=2 Tax=Altericroceibacterium spongiae TaxID=2320269 RepID=A0A420EM31_9SPHN|nr:hypothetical protein D6851_07070 [Altericroceibacterium spongiae]